MAQAYVQHLSASKKTKEKEVWSSYDSGQGKSQKWAIPDEGGTGHDEVCA